MCVLYAVGLWGSYCYLLTIRLLLYSLGKRRFLSLHFKKMLLAPESQGSCCLGLGFLLSTCKIPGEEVSECGCPGYPTLHGAVPLGCVPCPWPFCVGCQRSCLVSPWTINLSLSFRWLFDLRPPLWRVHENDDFVIFRFFLLSGQGDASNVTGRIRA